MPGKLFWMFKIVKLNLECVNAIKSAHQNSFLALNVNRLTIMNVKTLRITIEIIQIIGSVLIVRNVKIGYHHHHHHH